MFALYCVTAAFVIRFRTGKGRSYWVYRSFPPYLIYLITVDAYFYIKLLYMLCSVLTLYSMYIWTLLGLKHD